MFGWLLNVHIKKQQRHHPINKQDQKGNTQLHRAVSIRDNELLMQLLSDGADPAIKNNKKRDVFQHAQLCQNLKAMVLLDDEKQLAKAEEEVCYTVIQRQEFRLKDFAVKQRTEKVCVAALEYDDDAWRFIPDSFKQFDFLHKWAIKNPTIINFFPQAVNTDKLILAVLTISPSAILTINKPWNDSWIDTVLESGYDLLSHLELSQRTYSRCLFAVQTSGYNLSYVPEVLIDDALCKAALRHSSYLDLIPSSLLNEEYYVLAQLNQNILNYESLKLIPLEYLNYQLWQKSVESDYQCLEFVPEEIKTAEFFIAILEGREFMGFQLNFIFSYVPDNLIDLVKSKANFTYHIQPGEMD